jgi:predicted CXXCH cytochrome family protein
MVIGLLSSQPVFAEETICQSCHPDKVEGRYRHEPAVSGECAVCHQMPDPQNHQRRKASSKLTATGAQLCYGCHDNLAVKQHVHTPVARGDCPACHDPHRSSNPALLKATGAQLCLLCHKRNYTKKHVHAPVAAGQCLSCHDPHQSDNRFHLKKHGSALCLLCHRKGLHEGVSMHAPMADGGCLRCHQPHDSDNRKLLIKPFPEEFYLPYQNEHYALCYQCHSSQLVLDDQTLSSTDFRDGDRNLHNLHVNRPDYGRSCKTCHDPHTSSQAMLIKKNVPGYGKWKIPIVYTKSTSGGTCVVGCHKTKSYDRLEPVNAN